MTKKPNLHEACTGAKNEYGNDLAYGIGFSGGEFYLDSCCGGCAAAQDIKFCPYCGEKLVP